MKETYISALDIKGPFAYQNGPFLWSDGGCL